MHGDADWSLICEDPCCQRRETRELHGAEDRGAKKKMTDTQRYPTRGNDKVDEVAKLAADRGGSRKQWRWMCSCAEKRSIRHYHVQPSFMEKLSCRMCKRSMGQCGFCREEQRRKDARVGQVCTRKQTISVRKMWQSE